MSEKGAIYKIQVGDGSRKAIDIEGLKIFIENKKLEFNLLNLNPDLMKDLDVNTVIAKAAVETLAEIEAICDNALGLNKVEEKPSDEVSEEVTDPENVLPEDNIEEPVKETEPGVVEQPPMDPAPVPPELQEVAEQAADSEEADPVLVL